MHQAELKQLNDEANRQMGEELFEFATITATIRNQSHVNIEALKTAQEPKDKSIKALASEIAESINAVRSEPPVAPRLTDSEEMRLVTLCPTNAEKNETPTELPESVIATSQIRSGRPRITRVPIRPPPKSSTRLMSRAHTATVGKR
jgi:hypothetical protein